MAHHQDPEGRARPEADVYRGPGLWRSRRPDASGRLRGQGPREPGLLREHALGGRAPGERLSDAGCFPCAAGAFLGAITPGEPYRPGSGDAETMGDAAVLREAFRVWIIEALGHREAVSRHSLCAAKSPT